MTGELSKRELAQLLDDVRELLNRDYDLFVQQTTEENDQLLLLELAWLGAMMQEVSGSAPKPVSQSAQKELSAEHLLIGGLTLSEAFNKQKHILPQGIDLTMCPYWRTKTCALCLIYGFAIVL